MVLTQQLERYERELTRRAYEAGRAEGKRETLRELKQTLTDLRMPDAADLVHALASPN